MQRGVKSTGMSLVSVVIPCYNSALYIDEAIRSVLAQTYQNVETIVVDDGSTDDTKAVLIPYLDRVTYIHQENRGVSAARNLGVHHAKGQLIAFLDADDIWMPNKLEKQVEFLQKRPEVSLVFGDAEIFDVSGIIVRSFISEKRIASDLADSEIVMTESFLLLIRENFIVTSTVAVRRSCLEKVGGFDESLRSVEDRDLWLRIGRTFAIGYIPVVVTRKRVHESNLSSNNLVATISRVRALEKAWLSVRDKDIQSRAGVESALAESYFWCGHKYFARGKYREAQSHFRRSLSKRVYARTVAYYVATFLGGAIVTRLRRLKDVARRLFEVGV